MKFKEELEALSNLIRACGLIGAIYRKDHILLGDRTILKLSETATNWVLYGDYEIPKSSTPKASMISILELHLKILKNKEEKT